MDIDYDFWIIIILSGIAGGIFGPMLVRWAEKKGWIKVSRKKENGNSNS